MFQLDGNFLESEARVSCSRWWKIEILWGFVEKALQNKLKEETSENKTKVKFVS